MSLKLDWESDKCPKCNSYYYIVNNMRSCSNLMCRLKEERDSIKAGKKVSVRNLMEVLELIDGNKEIGMKLATYNGGDYYLSDIEIDCDGDIILIFDNE